MANRLDAAAAGRIVRRALHAPGRAAYPSTVLIEMPYCGARVAGVERLG